MLNARIILNIIKVFKLLKMINGPYPAENPDRPVPDTIPDPSGPGKEEEINYRLPPRIFCLGTTSLKALGILAHNEFVQGEKPALTASAVAALDIGWRNVDLAKNPQAQMSLMLWKIPADRREPASADNRYYSLKSGSPGKTSGPEKLSTEHLYATISLNAEETTILKNNLITARELEFAGKDGLSNMREAFRSLVQSRNRVISSEIDIDMVASALLYGELAEELNTRVALVKKDLASGDTTANSRIKDHLDKIGKFRFLFPGLERYRDSILWELSLKFGHQ